MSSITNYDGANCHDSAAARSPEERRGTAGDPARQPDRYPSPVRAMGSNHSLTPCAASTGTIVSMDGLTKIVKIDTAKKTLTAQAGLQLVDAAAALRKKKLQFMLNIEIGNLTLGSAACCQTKDSLDGVELGQVNSYVTAIKWVSPSGELRKPPTARTRSCLPLHPGQLRPRRHRLRGHVQDQAARDHQFDYDVHDVEELKERRSSRTPSPSNQSFVLWTIGDDIVIQSRNKARS